MSGRSGICGGWPDGATAALGDCTLLRSDTGADQARDPPFRLTGAASPAVNQQRTSRISVILGNMAENVEFRMERLQHIVAWFDKYLQGQDIRTYDAR
jgi:hypothetical protein